MSAGLNVVQTPSLILKDDFVKSLILNEKVDRPARPTPVTAVATTSVFNVTHAHREIYHCVAPSFHAAPGVKAGGRENMAVQPLTAMESKYNEPSEGDTGSGASLVSRARIPLTLNPRKGDFT